MADDHQIQLQVGLGGPTVDLQKLSVYLQQNILMEMSRPVSRYLAGGFDCH